jgi:(4S)-4-hydroxy-5-phosphonooxypentane-2,3-dione isomerase
MAYVVVSTWKVKEGEEGTAVAVLSAAAKSARQLEGTIAYRVNLGLEDPRRILVYQEFVDEAAFEAHRAGPHIQAQELRAVIDRLEWSTREIYRTAC